MRLDATTFAAALVLAGSLLLGIAVSRSRFRRVAARGRAGPTEHRAELRVAPRSS